MSRTTQRYVSNQETIDNTSEVYFKKSFAKMLSWSSKINNFLSVKKVVVNTEINLASISFQESILPNFVFLRFCC